MLGNLARWLRFAGFDATYDPATDDRSLAQVAREQGRWLVTRDRRLAASAGPRVLLVRATRLEDQVAELRSRLPLVPVPGQSFSRCSRCNGVLGEVERGRVADRVPPYVATHASRFRMCQGCGRVYWQGTHTARIARRVAELFPDAS
jgi:uncharacterized protein with PIN domain